jgi:hypothetical protein
MHDSGSGPRRDPSAVIAYLVGGPGFDPVPLHVTKTHATEFAVRRGADRPTREGEDQ